MQALLLKLLLGGLGSGLLVTILARLLPDSLVQGLGLRLGKLATALGAKHLSKKAWEKIEDFLVHSLGVFLLGLKEGLDSDDNDAPPPQPEPPKEEPK